MKLLIISICLFKLTIALAGEVETECVAMNESREKVIKEVKSKVVSTSKGSSAQ